MQSVSLRSRGALCFCMAALLTFGLNADAVAAGLFLPGHGIKPMGRGDAFVASGGGDLNSLWHNPANLATLGSLTLMIDTSLIGLDFEHTRAPRTLENGDTVTYETVRNQAPPKPNPQLMIGGPLPWKGLTFAFGIYGPNLTGETFPEDGPQRYVLVDNDPSLLLFVHAAVGWEVSSTFRVGAGIQNIAANFVIVNVVSGYPGIFGDPEDEDLDILTRITLATPFNLTGNIGIWMEVVPSVEVAVSAQLPAWIQDDAAKIETRLPSHAAFDDAEVRGDTLQAAMSTPMIARAAVRYHNDLLDYELAFVYEGWSIFKEIKATPNEVFVDHVRGIGTIKVPSLSIAMNWRDTFSIRNGLQLNIHKNVELRTGYIYETSAIPDEYYSVFLADSIKHVITLGGSYKGKDFSVDAGGAYFFMPDRTITNSKYRQLNPTDADAEYTLVVCNGEYTQRFMMFGLGFSKKF